jgi:serine/threonine protein kinase
MGADQTWISEREKTFDFVKVLDFGIAKIMIPTIWSPRPCRARCSARPSTCRPRPRAARRSTTAADVYSLGVILFDMLCGRPPFEAEQSSDVLKMHINKAPPSPREFAPHREITEAAEKVILRAMQKDAKQAVPERWPTSGKRSSAPTAR